MLFLVSLFLLFAIAPPFTAIPVKASQDSSGFPSITIESYTVGGVTTHYSGESIPVEAVIDFRVWVDLYKVDPVRIAFADGTSDSYSFGGAFSHDFYHAYDKAGEYMPEAYMPTDSGTFTGFPSNPIKIGESGTSGYDGVPTVTGVVPLDALINGVVIILSSIGGVFGASGSDAVIVGIVASVLIVSFFGTAVIKIKATHGKLTKFRTKSTQSPTLYVGGQTGNEGKRFRVQEFESCLGG